MIVRQAISIDYPARNAEEAIHAAGEALCQVGACHPEYV